MLLGVMFINLLCEIASRAPPVPASRRHHDVVTTQGAVRGYFAPHPPHYAYLGLPYSRRPTRHGRFKNIIFVSKAPEPPPRWDGIFEATHRVKCPQTNGAGDENCLVINIFTPDNATSLPVLVLIHDGDFQNGWGFYHPPRHFLRKDLVVVTFNYRIGVLGFLCLGVPEIPGNAGLKDQVAALYWVQKNIASFGGSVNDVTAYGIGSGAASIQLLLFSGITEGLFHKVILESGSALSPSSLSYNPFSKALDVATELGYQGMEYSEELVKFYQNIPIKQLQNVTQMFLPCIERDFHYSLLDKDPISFLKQGSFQKIPILMTYTSADKLLLIGKIAEKLDIVPENFELLLPYNLEFDSEETKRKIAELVKEFYFEDDIDLMKKFSKYIHDVFTAYPIVKSAQLHAARSSQPVYLLKFLYKSPTSENILKTYNPGAGLVNIIDYVYSKDHLTLGDELVAERLATLWSNFIKLSDPTPLATSLIPIIWQPVMTGSAEGTRDLSKVSGLLFDRTLIMEEHQTHQWLTFWDRIYDKFYKLYT